MNGTLQWIETTAYVLLGFDVVAECSRVVLAGVSLVNSVR